MAILKPEELDIGESIICISDRGEEKGVTVGKEYNIIDIDTSDDTVLLVNDMVERKWVKCRYFKKKEQSKTERKLIKMESLKSYFKKHEEPIITIALVVVIDEIIFKGVLRNKVQSILERMLDGATKQIESK